MEIIQVKSADQVERERQALELNDLLAENIRLRNHNKKLLKELKEARAQCQYWRTRAGG